MTPALRAITRRLGAGLLAGVALQAGAAAGPESRLLPSAAVECLVSTGGPAALPAYPEPARQIDRAGRVLVELQFSRADAPPAAVVVRGDAEFVDSVRAHVNTLRVPCLAPGGASATLRQEYLFAPDARRVATRPASDLADIEREKLLACITHQRPGSVPAYPASAQVAGLSARVPAELRFTAPDRPPEVQTFGNRYTQVLSRSVEAWATGLRMPCHQGEPVTVTHFYAFLFDDTPMPGFVASMPLRQWLGNVAGIRDERAAFDLAAMACPFRLRVTYLQPHRPNLVEQLDTYEPARVPLTRWLAAQRLDLAPRQQASVLGSDVAIEVPCGKIDLQPANPASTPPKPKEN